VHITCDVRVTRESPICPFSDRYRRNAGAR
jgi:hypothetical protein